MNKLIWWVKKMMKGRDCCDWPFCTNEVAGLVVMSAGDEKTRLSSVCKKHKAETIEIAEKALKKTKFNKQNQ